MDKNGLKWMKLSVDIANNTMSSRLSVGVVLTARDDSLICTAYTGEENCVSWSIVLLRKLRRLGVPDIGRVYLTVNSLTEEGLFEVAGLVKEVGVGDIYIGIPDPRLSGYLADDPAITFEHVYRYPDELQRQILEQNKAFYSGSKQSIDHSPFYFKNRISNLVAETLARKGFDVSVEELKANKNKSALVSLLWRKYGVGYAEATNVVGDAIAGAFNDKYSAYDYVNDTRSLDTNWSEGFMSCYRRASTRPLTDNQIVNVGVGSGNEALVLLSLCEHITFVDIAKDGLRRLKEQLPLATTIVASADSLAAIPDNSCDLYVSLRTYNSSFFDIKQAIIEARRVLRPNALIIISVANGFLHMKQGCIVPGLIIPGTDFVDIYRGMNTVGLIHRELCNAGFSGIDRYITNTEIYLSAVAT